MNKTFVFLVTPILILTCAIPASFAQAKRAPSKAPRIDVERYVIEATLIPDQHELSAVATITLKPIETTDVIVFEFSENLSVLKVTNADGVEVEFGQDEYGPGNLSIRFSRPQEAGKDVTVRIEYSGGFDRDRFSRIYSRDEGSGVYRDGRDPSPSFKMVPR